MKRLALIIFALLLQACATTYEVTRTAPDGVTTTLKVKSWREFPGGIDVRYDREAGAFELQAGEVSNDRQMAALLAALIPLIPNP